jgi:hypothetical protein
MQINEKQRNSTQIYEDARSFTKIHENHRKFPQVPTRPRNCRQRSASHFANWTYIAGYAPFCGSCLPHDRGVLAGLLKIAPIE